jgi:hypothetical protein
MLINSPNISGSLTVTGNAVITGSLTVAGGINATITGSATSASYVEYSNVANKPPLVSGSEQVSFNGITDKPTLVSGSSQVTYSGLSGIPSGIVSSSAQVGGYGIFATTGSNSFNGSQAITGSLTVTGQVVAQTLNVQQVTSSIVYSSGSNIFGNSLANTQQFTGSMSVTGSLVVVGTGNFSRTLTGNSSIFTNILVNALGEGVNVVGAAGNPAYYVTDQSVNNGGKRWRVGHTGAIGGFGSFDFYNQTDNITPLTLASTGAATFSSSVTATSFEVGNGQFFKARRSSSNLLLDLLGIESGTDNTRLLITGDYNIKNGSLSTLFNMTTTGAATFASSVTAGGEFTSTMGNNTRIFFSNTATTGYQYMSFKNTSGQMLLGVEGTAAGSLQTGNSAYSTVLTTVGATDLSLGTNQVERMRITSGGTLLIGTTAVETSTLAALALSTSTAAIQGRNPNSTTAPIFQSSSVTVGSTSWYAFVAQSGDGSAVTVNTMFVYGNGNIVNINNSYGALSDIKLKENIIDATPKLANIMQLKVRNFNLIADQSKTKQIGFIAQELEEVFPGIVEEVPDRDMENNELGTVTKTIKTSVLVPILVKAIQEQQSQIETLKSKIEILEQS